MTASNVGSAAATASATRESRSAGGRINPLAIKASSVSRPIRVASACRKARRGHRSAGRRLTIVSIMSSGAGSVGVSARPALPTTMATSGKRQRIMSRAFRSSPDSGADARGTVIGMSITIPSSSGVRNSRPNRRHRAIGDQRDEDEAPHRQQSRRPAFGGHPDGTIRNRASVASESGRLPTGVKPTTNVRPMTHASAAGRSIKYPSTGR